MNNDPIFTARVDKDPEGNLNIVFETPNWLHWGQYAHIHIVGDGIDPDRISDYKLLAQMGGESGETDQTVSFQPERVIASGDSHFKLLLERDELQFSDGTNAITMRLLKNHEGRLAGLESELSGVTFAAAIRSWRFATSAFLMQLIAKTRVSVSIDQLQVQSTDGGQYYIRREVGYPLVDLRDAGNTGFACMRPFYALYSEGVRATSPAYRFLCFYKITDKLLDRVAGKLSKLAGQLAIDRPALNGTLPEDPIAQFDRHFVGLKYTVARDRLRASHRNAIAHLDPNDPLQPFRPDAEGSAAGAAGILGFIATELLVTVHDWLAEAAAVGHDVNSLALAN